MGKKRKELTEEEIWDDTGLIESWNQSYEEYKQYHSIHARGERVEDALRAADEETADEVYNTNPTSSINGDTLHQDTTYTGTEDVGGITEVGPDSDDQVMVDAHGARNRQSSQVKVVDTNLTGQSIPNVAITQSSGDPALKDLMMSWYWAGYYTGLYEGQRQAANKTLG